MKKRIIAIVLAGLMVLSTGCSANVSVDPDTGVMNVDGVPINKLLEDIDPDIFNETTDSEETTVSEDTGDSEKPDVPDEARPGLPHFVKEGVNVVAVFAGAKAHKVILPELPEGAEAPEDSEGPAMTDTIWIYYSDNTFDQYAETPSGYTIFGTGTYSFKDDGDFNLDGSGDDIIKIDAHTVSEPGDTSKPNTEISREFNLGELGYEQLYGPADEGTEIAAIFGDDNQLIFEDKDGVINHFDSVWIMFKDMSFKQFAFINDDVKLYGDGIYEFDENGDFRHIGMEEESGNITLKYDYNMLLGKKPTPVTYDIKSLGLTCFYEYIEPVDNKAPEK